MKKHTALVFVCAACLRVASAANWQSSTRECSLQFPEVGWTLQEGGAVKNGQMLLAGINTQQTKSVNVLRFQVAPSLSVRDAKFVNGMKKGFTDAGSRFLNEGYTNVDGRTAYWFTGEKTFNEQSISTLNFSLCADGNLYQITQESIGTSPLCDSELSAIMASFRLNAVRSTTSSPKQTAESLAYQIGRVTGFVLVIILALGIVARVRRKRSVGKSCSAIK